MKSLILSVAACLTVCSVIAFGNTGSQIKCCDDGSYVDSLVNEIQNGSTTAFGSLGDCYRDGRGVERNLLNMINLYAMHNTCTGNDKLKAYCDSVDEYDYVRILNSLEPNDIDTEHLTHLSAGLRDRMPIEADALDVFINSYDKEKVDSTDIMNLENLADRGSETAVALLLVYAMKQDDNDIMLPYLLRFGDKYPMLLNQAGRIMWKNYKYRQRTEKVDDIALLKNAESCLVESFNRGFLNRKFAWYLKKIYKEYDRLNLLYYRCILNNLDKITADS